jgi:uncharacterized protein
VLPVIVADASPLIMLARIGQLELLARLYARVLVPEEVWSEAVLRKASAPDATVIGAAAFIERRTVDRAQAATVAETYGIDDGEAEALVLARQLSGAHVLVDDGRARDAAGKLGLRRVGTVGVLLRAKRAGWIDLVGPRLAALTTNRARMSRRLIDETLRRARE